MAGRSVSETERIRYLLGKSSPAEREHIESEFFENDDAFQEMLMAEDDLMDAYARGELAGEERRKFEKSFVSSLHGRNRVQFGRAFASAVSAPRSIETKPPSTLLDIFRAFQSPRLLWTATIAAVIVFVAPLAWLLIDRGRMTNELREVRVESAELSKRAEALQRSSDNERRRTAEIAAQLADLRARPDKPRRHEDRISPMQPARPLPEVKNGPKRTVRSKLEQEKLITTQDVLLGNSFVATKITELPLEARSPLALLTLPPATTGGGYVPEGPADQSNRTLDGVAVESFNTYSLFPRNTSGSDETTIRISSSLSWIRFHLALETAAIHEDYRVTIKTADGHFVTSVDWTEPLTPNQTIIDTPVIATGELSSGDYVLLLMGKEPDGSFVKVAEYSLKLIKQ